MQPHEEPPYTANPGGLPSMPPAAPIPPTGSGHAAPPPAEAAPGQESGGAAPERIKRTISSALWTGLIIGAILLILLIVFIAENSQSVKITLIFGDAKTSLALGLLLSAVIGALLVAVPGTIRILQLRKQLKRHLR